MSATLQAVYDARDGGYPGRTPLDEFCEWLAEHGIDAKDTYRIEIHLLDCPFARVFTYERDEHGDLIYDTALQDVVRRKPYDLPISSMPPKGAS